MGDQITQVVAGSLYYLPYSEMGRLKSLKISKSEMVNIVADACRLNTLYMIARAGSGHIGSSFSSMDIVCWLLLEELKDTEYFQDKYFSSKGHDAPGYYAALMACGKMDFELIHKLRRIEGLPGHPDIHTPCMVANTGSLGMGVSKAKGMLFANHLKGKDGRIFVMTGDGELQEGQFWESLVSAANHQLNKLTVIIDHNKLQSDTFVSDVSNLGDLEAKLQAFGWHVERIDGHDYAALSNTLKRINSVDNKPKVIIADTIKGKGVSFMEHTAMESDAEMYRFHSGAPEKASYILAAQELIDGINEKLHQFSAEPLNIESVDVESTAQPENPQKLIAAYSETLVQQAGTVPNIVALDADLILDTGLIRFQELYPNRFVECGIAEQDMVSQAGAMALNGVLPVVHSFACFLSARPNEQIYNNATEKTKVIYVGSLAGLLPGGPGHSHQAVRDISSLSAIPDLALIEPATEIEVKSCFEWSVNENISSSYIRLVSLPWPVPFSTPTDFSMKKGCGYVITEGSDAIIVSSGPVMLTEAYYASEILRPENIRLKVVNLPWLNMFDRDWLEDILKGISVLITLDNHYVVGGQGEQLIAAAVRYGLLNDMKVSTMGVDRVPDSGTHDEVLKAHNLDRASIVNNVKRLVNNPT